MIVTAPILSDEPDDEQGDPAALPAYSATETKITPDAAAAALPVSQSMGTDFAWTAENLDEVKRAHEQARLQEQLRRAPRVADYMAQSQAHAALVKPDVPILTMLGEGLHLGMLDIGTALEENRSAKEQLTPDEQQHLAELEQVTGSGVPGATTLPRKIGAEIARATPTLALFGLGTASGAGFGAAAGGTGGAVFGAMAASFGIAYTIGFGPLYRRLKSLVASDEKGVPQIDQPLLSDEEAKAWASAGAGAGAAAQVAIGAPFLKALPGVSTALRKVGLDAAVRAADSTVGKAAVRRLAEYGGHVLSGALAMGAQAGTSAAAVELAKGKHGGDPDWGAVTDAAAEGFKSGLLLAPLSAYEPMRAFMHDYGRVENARLDAFALASYRAVVQDMELSNRAPAEAERVIASLAAGTAHQTVYVSPEALTPEARGAVEQVAGPAAMAEAQATNGAVAVPVEKYLVRLGEQHEAMASDVKLSPDGMTPREAEEWQKKLADITEPLNTGKLTEIAARGLGRTPTDDEVRATISNLRALGFDIEDVVNDPAVKAAMAAEAPEPHPLAAAVASVPPEDQAKVVKVLRPEPVKAADYLSRGHMLRDLAEGVLEGKRLGEIQPGRYREAARRAADRLASVATEAAREAVEGAHQGAVGAGVRDIGKDKTPAAGTQNLQEAGKKVGSAESALEGTKAMEGARDFNRELQKAAEAKISEAEKNRKFLLGFTQDDKRAELGKAGDQYLAQVDRLLAGFELGQGVSRTDVARRLATMQWIAEEQAANRDPVIPDSVMNKLDRFVHWKELTPQELRDLRGAVESVARQAELKNTMLDRQVRVDRAQAKTELIASLRANTETRPFRPTGSTVGNLQRVLDYLSGLKYGARGVERIINMLDGGDINGPWHRYIWDPINDTTHGWHDLVRRTTQEVVKVIDEMPREGLKRWRETRIRVNGVDYDLTAAIAVALNSGNDSNRQKLLRGWQDDSVARRGLAPWTEDTPEQFLKHLTRKDWEFVQTVWDRLETMWPEAAALEKRLTGLEPPRVKPRPFTRTLEDGSKVDLQGGYYPLIYDSDFSGVGKGQEEASANRSVQLFDRNYYRAATPQGHLQQRIEGFARPILLSLDALPHKVSEAAKDTTMREALLSVHSALTDDDISAALHTSELGRAGEKVLLGWLRDTANDLSVPDNGAGPWFSLQSRARSGYTASLFAYNLGQTAQNLTAIAPATVAVGPKWMTNAMLRLARERGPLIEWMTAQSGELRNFERGGQAVADAMKSLSEKPGVTSDFMRFGMKFFQSTDIAVKYPTWLAAYMKGIADKDSGGLGYDHDTAVRHGDATVRLNVMAGNTKDLPALLRSRIGRWMLPLYSYNLHRLNLLADTIGAARGALRQRAVGRASAVLGGMWGALAMEAVLSEVVKGNGPSDENDDGEVTASDVAIWTAKISALAPLFWLPVLGSGIRAAATGRAPMGTPESSVMADVGGAVRQSVKLVGTAVSSDEQVDEDQVKALTMQLLKAAGDVGGVPAQVRTTAGYLLDEESPSDTPLQVGLGVAFGKKRPGKLLDLTE